MIWLDRYAEYLEQWLETPYSDATCKMGKGVNCLRFTCLMQDWLHGFNPKKLPPVPRLPRQTAIHNPKKAMVVIRFMCRRYPGKMVFRPKRNDPGEIDLQPADIVVNQVSDGHPSHILIAGPRKNVLWHSCNEPGRDGWGGVDQTGLGWCLQQGIYGIWRPKAVVTWI